MKYWEYFKLWLGYKKFKVGDCVKYRGCVKEVWDTTDTFEVWEILAVGRKSYRVKQVSAKTEEDTYSAVRRLYHGGGDPYDSQTISFKRAARDLILAEPGDYNKVMASLNGDDDNGIF